MYVVDVIYVDVMSVLFFVIVMKKKNSKKKKTLASAFQMNLIFSANHVSKARENAL